MACFVSFGVLVYTLENLDESVLLVYPFEGHPHLNKKITRTLLWCFLLQYVLSKLLNGFVIFVYSLIGLKKGEVSFLEFVFKYPIILVSLMIELYPIVYPLLGGYGTGFPNIFDKF